MGNQVGVEAIIDDRVIDAIFTERLRQIDKWRGDHRWGRGDCSSSAIAPIVKVAVLSEECGEVARAVLDERDNSILLRELIQVAAVAIAWAGSIIDDKESER